MYMEVGLSLPIAMTSEQKEDYVLKAKEIGVSSIWVGDNPPINNAFLDIGRLIGNIKKMDFWTGITSPFYYSLEVLFSLSVWLSKNYPKRFGLGLGIGNLNLIQDEDVKNQPFTHYKTDVDKLLNLVEIRKAKQGEYDFPQLAFGGLGKRMINYATEKANYLLLNSPSTFDIERAYKIVSNNPSKNKRNFGIVPYGMMQIKEENKEISATMWNITKDIAKGSSDSILKSHGYSNKKIQQIRELSWERYNEVPKGEILEICSDFGLMGTIEQIFERMDYYKQLNNKKMIDSIVLGWIHSEDQWDYIKQIVDYVK